VRSSSAHPNTTGLTAHRHAAASYGHIPVLEYLVSKGGDVNVTDEDGDTPLYTVETTDIARWLIDHGAKTDIRNAEGLTPAEHLDEDFPEIATYLRSTANEATNAATTITTTAPTLSQHAQESASSALTDSLIASAAHVLAAADAAGSDPTPELQNIVESAVLQSIRAGHDLGAQASDNEPRADSNPKRQKNTEP
jgi:uncharacterized protein